MNIFGSSYEDTEIITVAENAIADDPALGGMQKVNVTCEEGVVTLTGQLNSEREKNSVEQNVRTALERASLSFDRIENDIHFAS